MTPHDVALLLRLVTLVQDLRKTMPGVGAGTMAESTWVKTARRMLLHGELTTQDLDRLHDVLWRV